MRKFSILSLLLWVCVLQPAKAEGIEFFEGDWAEVVQKASEEDKYIMLDAYTTWCYWCKVMERETFPDDRVADFFNKNFVNVRMDMEAGEGIALAQKYRVFAFPTILFFDPAGKLVYKESGYKQPDPFIEMGQKALDPEQQFQTPGDPLVMNPGFPQFYLDAFQKSGSMGKTEVRKATPEEVQAYLAEHKSLQDEAAWAVTVRFGRMDESIPDRIMSEQVALINRYGEDEVMGVLRNYVYTQISPLLEEPTPEKLDQGLMTVGEYLGENDGGMGDWYRRSYYKSRGEWKPLIDMVELQIEDEGIEELGWLLNDVAWSLFEDCDDEGCLKAALEWMNRLDEGELHDYASMDTHAALLYKLGMYKAAEKMAEHAIELGTEEGHDVEPTRKMLQEIQAEL